MNLGIKWLWKDTSKIKVDKLKKDVQANTASITNLENTKANKTYVDSQLANKADTTYVNSQLANKADTTYVNSQLANKADTTYVNNQLNSKADTTTVNNIRTELANKADISYVNNQIGRKTQVYDPSTNSTIGQINYYIIPFQITGNVLYNYSRVAKDVQPQKMLSVSLWYNYDWRILCLDGGMEGTYDLRVAADYLDVIVDNKNAGSGVNQYELHILYAGTLTPITQKVEK